MGNTALKRALPNLPTAHEKQGDCSFTHLPDELTLAIVEYLALKEFICLITTCKYYNYELLGRSNILWAHICKSLGNINFIIRSIQFGRRWKIDGQTVDLNKAIDVTDKNTLATFNFREIIEEYFLRVLHKSSIRSFVEHLISSFLLTASLVTVEIVEYSPSNLRNYWMPDKPGQKFRKDYFFAVDLDVDPESVSKLFLESVNVAELPYTKGGRIVVYKKSKTQPAQHPATFYNRMEVGREFSTAIRVHNDNVNNGQEDNTK